MTPRGDARMVCDISAQVSSSFAAAATYSKEGESTFDAKLSCLEQRLKEAEIQALNSQVNKISDTVHCPRWEAPVVVRSESHWVLRITP